MGIQFSMIETMQELGLFTRDGAVLDIGSSNLYSATPSGILRFLRSFGVSPTSRDAEFAGALSSDSMDGSNKAFVGELFERVGMRYSSVDIAPSYRTEILDLNHCAAPPHLVGAFDLVLNFGTTEHVLNQYNAFKVMHDCARPGGFIVNEVPAAGYSNHGYFTYTPRCFFDLAGYNEYEIVRFWFEGPGQGNDLFAPVRDYQSYFPSLASTLCDRDATESGRKIAQLEVPDVGMMVIFRKVKALPFMGSLERSTSVGDVPSSVTMRREPEAVPELTDPNERTLRDRLLEGSATQADGLRLYSLMTERGATFPLAWEERVLGLCLAEEPDRLDLLTRLREVLLIQGKAVPDELTQRLS